MCNLVASSAHLVDCLVVEVLYTPEVGLHQLDVVSLGEEAHSPRVVQPGGGGSSFNQSEGILVGQFQFHCRITPSTPQNNASKSNSLSLPGGQDNKQVVQQHGLVVQVELDGAVVHLDIGHLGQENEEIGWQKTRD